MYIVYVLLCYYDYVISLIKISKTKSFSFHFIHCYIALLHREILQEQLDSLTQQMENKERAHKSHIAQVQEEINVVRLELSSSKNENQKLKLMFNDRMSQVQQNEKELEQNLENKVKECQALVKDKHTLRRENTELQSLCEELMNMMEKGVHSAKTDGSPSAASRSSRSSRSTGWGY